MLRTNTELEAAEVARACKSLWRVERTFRETKSMLEVRPIFHHRDDTSIGHIVAAFLALRLEVDMQRRMEEKEVSWPDFMRDLGQVQAVRVELDGKIYILRTDLQEGGSSWVPSGWSQASLAGNDDSMRKECSAKVIFRSRNLFI